MALLPPDDFKPVVARVVEPSQAELRDLWKRRERRARDRERSGQWRRVVEELRRRSDGEVQSSGGGCVFPSFLRGGRALGSRSRSVLRPVARRGRVVAAGVDTWSPCWYAEAGSPLSRAMRGLATQPAGRSFLLPEDVGGYRVGWFPDSGLVFAEGSPGGVDLCSVVDLAASSERLVAVLGDLGVPILGLPSAGLRRLDVAVDLWTDSSPEGLAFLECVGSASLGVGKLATYRMDRCVESVFVKSKAGQTQARVYDKGGQLGSLPRGRWIRLEGQWRFAHGSRLLVDELAAVDLRGRFRRRFESLWQAAAGFQVGGAGVVAERLAAAVASGQLRPSRARTVAGYLLLAASGVPQGSSRVRYELERECRELGLSVSLLEGPARRVDVATVLEECMASEVWVPE